MASKTENRKVLITVLGFDLGARNTSLGAF